MSDLPPLIAKSFDELKLEIAKMRRGGSSERQKPHKIIMLLAVLDLVDEGLLSENKIYFSEPLFQHFEKHFRLISSKDDWFQPAPPFFHLRSASFWFLQPKPGRENEYKLLKTSGGGSKRIQENIEYAYLSEPVYRVFLHPEARKEMREYLFSLARMAMPKQRLKTVFHESFSLSKPSLSQVLSVALSNSDIDFSNREQRFETLRENTNLGTNYVKAMPRYAIGAGLLDAEYNVTTLGKYVSSHDPLLELTNTQWLIHYHLSAPQGPGPIFWNNLVTKYFHGGQEFTTEELAGQISNYYKQIEGEELSDRSARSTATIFLGTYTKTDGLANLNLIQTIDTESYRVNDDIDPPPTWAVAYAILDYWKSQFPGRTTVNLDDFSDENGLSDLFLIGAGKMANILQKMQAEGFVDIFRVAPPYQVVLLRPEIDATLEKLYSHE